MNLFRMIFALIGLLFASVFSYCRKGFSFVFLSILCAFTFGVMVINNLSLLKVDQDDIAELLNWKPITSSKIWDGQGNLIEVKGDELYETIQYAQIPKPFIDALIAIEDQRFFQHPGIDLAAIMRATFAWIERGQITQGASTITQQVVRNFLLGPRKKIKRKIREWALAIYLENHFSKEKILEIYCNQMFLGEGAYGVAAAAKKYFGRKLSDLHTAELALLAGLYQAPTHLNPFRDLKAAIKRQHMVLQAMEKTGAISSWKILANSPLRLKRQRNDRKAPYFSDQVWAEAAKILGDSFLEQNLNVYTGLDLRLQKAADQAAQKLPEELKHLEVAILAIDRRSGEIKAMVGGKNYFQSQFNRTVDLMRAPGSAFKPVTYSLALEKKKNWADLVLVTPTSVGNYRPRGQLNEYFTETTLLRAFYKSLNGPAMDLGMEFGLSAVEQQAQKLGLWSPFKNEAGSLLGSSEVTLFDLARLYSVFANDGQRVSPFMIKRIESTSGKLLYESNSMPTPVLEREVSDLIKVGLQAVVERGTGQGASSLAGYVAGKTGTTNEAKDNWFCGFSENLVVITWVGSDDNSAVSNQLSSSQIAVPVWTNFMKESIHILKSKPLRVSPTLSKRQVDSRYGTLGPQGEWMYFREGEGPQRKENDFALYQSKRFLRYSF